MNKQQIIDWLLEGDVSITFKKTSWPRIGKSSLTKYQFSPYLATSNYVSNSKIHIIILFNMYLGL